MFKSFLLRIYFGFNIISLSIIVQLARANIIGSFKVTGSHSVFNIHGQQLVSEIVHRT